MNLAQRSMPGDQLRRPLPLLGFIGLFIVTVYKAANYVITGDMKGLAYVTLLFTGSAFVVAMLNSWRNGVYFFLAWLLFEDFARKFLGNNMAIYFAKDVLVAVVYLSAGKKPLSSGPRSSCRFFFLFGLECCRCLILRPPV